MPPVIALLVLAAIPAMAGVTPPELTISAESAPAGGWTQFKFLLSRPAAIGSARIQCPPDSAVFEAIERVAVFSAHGDAAGAAILDGPSATLTFTSATSGIGRALDLPVVAVVTARVRAGAPIGRTTIVSGEAALNGQSVTVRPSTFRVAGNRLTVRSIAGGSPVVIEGAGFLPGVSVEIDGMPPGLAARYVNSARLEVPMPEPLGRRFRVVNTDGEAVTAYASADLTARDQRGYYPVFGPIRNRAGDIGAIVPNDTFLAVRNPNDSPVRIAMLGSAARVSPVETASVMIMPGETAIHRVQWPNYNVSMAFRAELPVQAVLLPNAFIPAPKVPAGALPVPLPYWFAGLPLAPGKIVTVYGAGLGSIRQVLFDEEPGSILYASSTQINVAVPASIAGRDIVRVNEWDLPVAPASPLVFTADGTGAGQAATESAEPVPPRGAAIRIFATGLGLQSSPGNVRVLIGGVSAEVTEVDQPAIGVIVPPSAPVGNAVPIVVRVDEATSQDNVTIPVR